MVGICVRFPRIGKGDGPGGKPFGRRLARINETRLWTAMTPKTPKSTRVMFQVDDIVADLGCMPCRLRMYISILSKVYTFSCGADERKSYRLDWTWPMQKQCEG